MKNRTCVECGTEFTPHHNAQICCSRTCAEKRDNRRRREARHSPHRKRRSYAVKSVAPVSLSTLMSASRKPNGCSAVRWRIELRRRAAAEYYHSCGDPLRR